MSHKFNGRSGALPESEQICGRSSTKKTRNPIPTEGKEVKTHEEHKRVTSTRDKSRLLNEASTTRKLRGFKGRGEERGRKFFSKGRKGIGTPKTNRGERKVPIGKLHLSRK